MPDRKKARDLTDQEALKRLFPKNVRDELKKKAHEKDVSETVQNQPKGPQTKCK